VTDKTEGAPGEFSQAEKLATLLNDARLREQGATFAGFAQAEANIDRGRYGAHEKTVVVTGGAPVYPAGPAWSTADQSLEPPLGYRIDAMPESESAAVLPAADTGEPVSDAAPSSPSDVQRAGTGSPSSSADPGQDDGNAA
jgi:hypothetical protein